MTTNKKFMEIANNLMVKYNRFLKIGKFGYGVKFSLRKKYPQIFKMQFSKRYLVIPCTIKIVQVNHIIFKEIKTTWTKT